MKKLFTSISSLLSLPWKYHELIWQLTKREVTVRYRGSIMGSFWSFLNPLFMLLVYTFFFSIIFQARFGAQSNTKFDFAITLFAGLIPFTLFSECINRAPQLILNNVNYVKKVLFPLEILSWVNLLTAVFHMLISTGILLLFFLLINHTLHWTVVFLPLVNLPLVFLILGLSWILSSLGVFIRDINQAIHLATTSLLFLSPIFYSISMIPEPYRQLIQLNPLTAIIEQNRAVIILGQMPDISLLGINLIISLIIFCLGYYLFEKMRAAFADVV